MTDENPLLHGDKERLAVQGALGAARASQSRWQTVPVRVRLEKVAVWRGLLAARAGRLSGLAAGPGHSPGEVLVSELLPLLEACRFLEKNAASVLSERRLGRWSAPLWMGRVDSTVFRQPYGVVGVVSPGNYPLYLGAVQVIQALVAGNAVLWKPAPGCGPVACALAQVLEAAGFPTGLVQVLGDSDAFGRALSEAAVDKLLFTGSHSTGLRVLRSLAARAVPAVMELSGCDALFVRADADVERVVRAMRFGLLFNQSRTCIAPRRAYVHAALLPQIRHELGELLEAQTPDFAPERDAVRLRDLFESASQRGARFLCGGLFPDGQRVLLPAVFEADAQTAALFHGDFFVPLLVVVSVENDEEALRLDAECEYALGASVFSRDEKAAHALAVRLRAGAVTINDVIAPTADPRVPFGGAGASGFGSTRGPEGLLEMSRPKVVQTRRDAAPAHLSGAMPSVEMLAAVAEVLHGGGFAARGRALAGLLGMVLRAFFRGGPLSQGGRVRTVDFRNSPHSTS